MGETVSFTSNGDEVEGYLAVSEAGSGPGLLVVQEWWGLVPQIKRVADRLAQQGFTALAPDLYRGDIAEHTEMDKAAQLMNTLPHRSAARDMAGAIDYLLAHPSVTGDAVGVIGFCMGGMLTLVIAAQQGEKVAAAAPFYGAPLGDSAPDWSNLSATVLGHFAENDDFFPADADPRPRAGAARARQGRGVRGACRRPATRSPTRRTRSAPTTPEAADKAVDHAIEFLHAQLG